MSTRKGANTRTRPQAHKNRTAFKNDLYGATPQLKQLNNMNVSEVCDHCKGVIEWKIKYKKYKPLSKPKTCTKCGERTVRKAYHVNCTDCALKLRCCAKCNISADETHIVPPEPSPQEQMKLDQEMQLLIKKLPERKRRTFLRYMKKGKKKDKEGEQENGDGDSDPELSDSDGEQDGEGKKKEVVVAAVAEEKPKEKTIPYTKEELLLKLEQMKLALENDDDDFDDDFFGSDEDDDGEEDDSDGEEEEDSEEEEEKVEDKKKKKGVTFGEGVKK